MMNKRGQALVEFVLILPVLIFIIFTAIDFGIVFNEKNHLENDSLDIINLYNKGTSIDELENIYKKYDISVTDDTNYYNIKISKNIKLRTPGLGKIMGNPYKIEIERVVPYA